MTANGGEGDDQLSVGTGPTTLDGGPGGDWLLADMPGATAADVFSCGYGHDTVFYTYHFTGWTITLDATAPGGPRWGRHADQRRRLRCRRLLRPRS